MLKNFPKLLELLSVPTKVNLLSCIIFRRYERLKLLLFLIYVTVPNVYCNATYNCSQAEACSSYINIAADMISKAKNHCNNSCTPGNWTMKPVDCAELFQMGHKNSGIYEIWPMSRLTNRKPLSVYCDMGNGGGWTVIQRRGDYKRSIDYFFKDWKNYKEGFGDLDKDFWLGNDNIFALTNQKLYSARFDLKDVQNNHRYALYDKFWIDDENHKYTLHIYDYSGNAGDSMLFMHNNQKFTTKDQDNDFVKDNCALNHKGAWWYGACHHANLNGIYYKGRHESFADGVNWHSWKDYRESLLWTEIKIRPRYF